LVQAASNDPRRPAPATPAPALANERRERWEEDSRLPVGADSVMIVLQEWWMYVYGGAGAGV
jgi:hypothetical protein